MDGSPKTPLSTSLLDALLGSVGEIVFVLDGQGQVRGASRGVLERTGLEQEALAGHPWPELCRPSEEARDILNELARDEEPAYFQTRLIGAEQAIRPVVLSVQRFGSEPDGGYLVFGYDLERSPGDALREDATQLAARVNRLQESLLTVNRQLGETALQLAEEQQKMKAVMASLGEGMLVLDPGRRIVQAGGTTEELLGLARTELLGRKAEAIVPELFQALERIDKKIDAAGGDPGERILKDVRFERQGKILRANLAPIVDSENRELGTVITFEDFTRLSEIDRMKSELISIVSHELRTPLSSIKGYIELLIEDQSSMENNQRGEFLSVVKANTERLVDLVDVMLDIDRIESGRLQLEYETFDLAYAAQYVYSTFRPAAEAKTINLQMQTPQGMEIRADLDRVIQMISNLVSNAIKYTPEGGTVVVRALEEGDSLRIEVEDNGPGISSKDQERLFEKFFRASGSGKVKGTGLGLSITRSLAEAHGGSASARSELGKGSVFVLHLPRQGKPAAADKIQE
jgi:PAS domain S-box-containing protein